MRRVLVSTLLLAACRLPTAFGQAGETQPETIAAEFRHLEQQVESGHADDVLHGLPGAWRVDTPSGVYAIPSDRLRVYLASSNREAAGRWLDHAAQELEGWRQAQNPQPVNARAKLESILARRDFARGAPPGPLELLRERVLAWLRRLLDWLAGLIEEHPGASRALFWTLVAAAAGFLVLWLVRLGKREQTWMALRQPEGPLPVRDWEQWIAAARLAAEQGDLRQAIHACYWAGVTRLQQTGVLSAERTFTPREYLSLARGSGQAEHLSALTRSLERFWYADREASLADFRESLQHLERLGCRIA